MYLTHYAVHTPIQAKAELTAKYKKKKPIGGHNNPAYAAMVESMDDSIGAVQATLKRLKLDDNTIVIFFADNGGHGGVTSNAPPNPAAPATCRSSPWIFIPRCWKSPEPSGQRIINSMESA